MFKALFLGLLLALYLIFKWPVKIVYMLGNLVWNIRYATALAVAFWLFNWWPQPAAQWVIVGTIAIMSLIVVAVRDAEKRGDKTFVYSKINY